MKIRRQKVFCVLVACFLCASFFAIPVSAASDDVISIDMSNLQSDAKIYYSSDDTVPDLNDLSVFDSAQIVKDSEYFSFTIPEFDPPSHFSCFLSFNVIDPVTVTLDYVAQFLSGSFSIYCDDYQSSLVSFYLCLYDSDYNLLGFYDVDADSYFFQDSYFTYSLDNVSIPITTSGQVSFVSLGFCFSCYPRDYHSFDVIFNDISMNFKMVAMESFLDQVGFFFTQSMDWLGDVLSIVVSTPALLIFTIAFVICGFAVALLDRMKKQ